jgi:hypothetical protein
VRIRLTKKLAELLNGVNLSPYRVGDEFDCPEWVGRMLILEAWAEPVDSESGLDNEQPTGYVWDIIEEFRDGHKNRFD